MSTITTQPGTTAPATARPSGARGLLASLAFARSTTDRPADVGLLVARAIVGAVFIGHGAGKLFGWGGRRGHRGHRPGLREGRALTG